MMPRRPSTVAVLLGTDHHPFTRMVGWAQRLAATTSTDWFVQHGSTPLPPGLVGRPLLGVDDLEALLARADVVVTHGGPGLIMEAHAAGHHPIVVPRDPARGEHVDGHQQRFCARIARDGLITVADDLPTLSAAVASALARGRRPAERTATSSAVTHRLGLLVDDLLAHRAGVSRRA